MSATVPGVSSVRHLIGQTGPYALRNTTGIFLRVSGFREGRAEVPVQVGNDVRTLPPSLSASVTRSIFQYRCPLSPLGTFSRSVIGSGVSPCIRFKYAFFLTHHGMQ